MTRQLKLTKVKVNKAPNPICAKEQKKSENKRKCFPRFNFLKINDNLCKYCLYASLESVYKPILQEPMTDKAKKRQKLNKISKIDWTKLLVEVSGVEVKKPNN